LILHYRGPKLIGAGGGGGTTVVPLRVDLILNLEKLFVPGRIPLSGIFSWLDGLVGLLKEILTGSFVPSEKET
jgi:hypothetical protein